SRSPEGTNARLSVLRGRPLSVLLFRIERRGACRCNHSGGNAPCVTRLARSVGQEGIWMVISDKSSERRPLRRTPDPTTTCALFSRSPTIVNQPRQPGFCYQVSEGILRDWISADSRLRGQGPRPRRGTLLCAECEQRFSRWERTFSLDAFTRIQS